MSGIDTGKDYNAGKVREMIRRVERDGSRLVWTAGSHRQFHHPTKPGTVTIAGKSSVEIPPKRCVAFCARRALPGCVAAGETEQEVRQLIREAIPLHLELMRQAGEPIPQPSSEADLVEV